MLTDPEIMQVIPNWMRSPWIDVCPSLRNVLKQFAVIVGEGPSQSRLALDQLTFGPTDSYLGKGNYGVVLAATALDGTRRAVKLFDIDARFDEPGLHSLVREMAAGVQCRSPYVVHYYELVIKSPPERSNDAPPACYLVRELVPGKSPDDELQRHPEQIVPVFHTLAQGLRDMHEKRLVHRDVKLQNAIVHEGIGKWVDLGQVRIASTGTGKTTKVVRMNGGTRPVNIPPEAWANGAIQSDSWNRPGDIYAFGTMLFWLLVTRWPTVEPETGLIQIDRHALKNCCLAPTSVTRLIERMLAVNPANRPDARVVVQEIERGLTGSRNH